MVTIVQNGDKVLRKISKDVPLSSITQPKIKKIIEDMNIALDSQYDGVAIAAPQIGVSLRIFVISGKVFDEDFIKGNKTVLHSPHPNVAFINPFIKKISKDRKLMPEGCLSVRPVYGKVRRATRVTIEALDQKGKKITMNGSGLLAHIFQHELDHLDGVLFIDKAKDLHDSYPEEEFK